MLLFLICLILLLHSFPSSLAGTTCNSSAGATSQGVYKYPELHIILSFHAFLKMFTKIFFHMTDSAFSVIKGSHFLLHRELFWVFWDVSNIVFLVHLINYFQSQAFLLSLQLTPFLSDSLGFF